MRSHYLAVTLAAMITSTTWLQAQVQTLGTAPIQGGVEQAYYGCSSCASGGCAGCDGPAYSAFNRGPCCHHSRLYPPCPNPCHGTIIGDFVFDLKQAIHMGVANLFGCYRCGICSACGCVPYDCSCGCDYCSDCGGGSSGGSLEPTPAPPAAEDPFGDDPEDDSKSARINAPLNPVGSSVRRAEYIQGQARGAKLPVAQKPNRTLPRQARSAIATLDKSQRRFQTQDGQPAAIPSLTSRLRILGPAPRR